MADHDQIETGAGRGGDGQRDGEPAYRPPAPAPVFNIPGSIMALAAVCILVHVGRVFVLGDRADGLLVFNLAFIPARYVLPWSQWDMAAYISPVTYAFLHGDWLHLGINLVWLAAFGAPLAFRLGALRTLIFWIVTALCAVLLHAGLYWGDPVPLIGASGAVSGFMGAAARFGFRSDRRNPRRGFAQPLMGPVEALRAPGVFGFLLVWMVVNYLAGAGLFGGQGEASIAWEAHIGGLVAGYALIGLVDRQQG